MNKIQQGTGVPGMLRPFKEYIESSKITTGAQVVFFGLPGTCLPFVELLCYAIRNLSVTPVFVPALDTSKARILINDGDTGFQVGDPTIIIQPALVILMGGLSMPGSRVEIAEVSDLLARYPETPVIGVCFMHMFEIAGWTRTISFDLMIDASVTVEVFSPA